MLYWTLNLLRGHVLTGKETVVKHPMCRTLQIFRVASCVFSYWPESKVLLVMHGSPCEAARFCVKRAKCAGYCRCIYAQSFPIRQQTYCSYAVFGITCQSHDVSLHRTARQARCCPLLNKFIPSSSIARFVPWSCWKRVSRAKPSTEQRSVGGSGGGEHNPCPPALIQVPQVPSARTASAWLYT